MNGISYRRSTRFSTKLSSRLSKVWSRLAKTGKFETTNSRLVSVSAAKILFFAHSRYNLNVHLTNEYQFGLVWFGYLVGVLEDWPIGSSIDSSGAKVMIVSVVLLIDIVCLSYQLSSEHFLSNLLH